MGISGAMLSDPDSTPAAAQQKYEGYTERHATWVMSPAEFKGNAISLCTWQQHCNLGALSTAARAPEVCQNQKLIHRLMAPWHRMHATYHVGEGGAVLRAHKVLK